MKKKKKPYNQLIWHGRNNNMTSIADFIKISKKDNIINVSDIESESDCVSLSNSFLLTTLLQARVRET